MEEDDDDDKRLIAEDIFGRWGRRLFEVDAELVLVS